jgi:hypothetical protein
MDRGVGLGVTMAKPNRTESGKKARQASDARWRAANPEAVRAIYARHHAKHRDKRVAENKDYYAINRATVNAAKNVPCTKCGMSFPVVCMDLHHRDPASKLFGIGARVGSFGPERLAAEIAKCDAYCANCHRLIEHGE